MKIFQIITLSELGGAQSVLLGLANNLVNEHEVFVVGGREGAMWDQLDERVKQIKLKSLKRSISPFDLLVWIRLAWLGIKYRPDIVHLHSSKIGILGRLAFRKKKIIYTVHGFDSIRVAYRKFLPIEKLLKKRAKAIVAVSRYDHRNLHNESIDRNVFTVYNGIVPVVTDRSVEIPVEPRKKTVMTIARIDPQKKYSLFAELARTLPQYNFVWIGNRIVPPDQPDNMFCLGEIPNAARYYALSDLCLLPSNYEGLPMTIIEAMSLAKPVVASNVGGISEIVLNGENGYCVENETGLFVEKIMEILENKELYHSMCQKSKQIFETRLTVRKMVENYLKVYQS
jgi:glycosyltransferase involved in cell wall biosynthesis